MGISHTGVAYDQGRRAAQHRQSAESRNTWAPAIAASSTASTTARCSSSTSSGRAISPTPSAPTSSPGRRASPPAPGASIPRRSASTRTTTRPSIKSGKPVDFVKQLGQIGLGQDPPGNVGMFCSEFAWSLLALRDCDPTKSADAFKKSGVPSCVKPIMEPMKATGDYITRRGRSSMPGLAEGPLLVIDSLKLPDAERDKLLHTVFVENKAGLAKMSVGHRQVAEKYQVRLREARDVLSGRQRQMGPDSEGAPDQLRLQKRHPAELFAHVLPHQHAASCQQHLSDDGLRRDHRDRVGGEGVMRGSDPLRTRQRFQQA